MMPREPFTNIIRGWIFSCQTTAQLATCQNAVDTWTKDEPEEGKILNIEMDKQRSHIAMNNANYAAKVLPDYLYEYGRG